VHRPVPELRPTTWLATAPSNVDWRDVGGGLVGTAGGPGYSVEAAGRVLMERHIADGRLHVTVRPASAVTGSTATSLHDGLQLGSPDTAPTGWLAAVSPLLEIDGHLARFFADRPVYFPASVEQLLVLPAHADLTRAYLWSAMTWRNAGNPVTPLAMTLGDDRLTTFVPAEERADHALHRDAVLLAAGHRGGESNYHGTGTPAPLVAAGAHADMHREMKSKPKGA